MKPQEIVDYAKEKQLSNQEVTEWFLWAVHNLLSEEEIKGGIDSGSKPIEVWKNRASRDKQ